MSDLEEQKPGVSRRTVAKAMAWSVPAVALAVPTPAYAASPEIITVNGAGCKLPGASGNVFKGYAFRATISNMTNAQITVTIVDMTLGGSDLGNVRVVRLNPCSDLGTNTFVVAANTTFDVALLTQNAANSANGQLIISFTVDGGPVQQVSTAANAAPPIQGASCSSFSQGEKNCIDSFDLYGCDGRDPVGRSARRVSAVPGPLDGSRSGTRGGSAQSASARTTG